MSVEQFAGFAVAFFLSFMFSNVKIDIARFINGGK